MEDRDEVVERLVAWAQAKEGVRAVVLTGSRAAPGRHIDGFSDHDVALFLRDASALEADEGWFRDLGSVLVTLSDAYETLGLEVSSRLVQYRDGTKIDFTLFPTGWLERVADEGRLPPGLDAGYRVLVDKDGLCRRVPKASGSPVVPELPDADRFHGVVNEFWWETLYVAKLLARGEVLPARYSAECVIRYRCLVPMLEWDLVTKRDGEVSVGPHGRGVAPLRAEEDRTLLERSFPMGDVEEGWTSLFAAVDLFERAALRLADALGHPHPEEMARAVRSRLEAIRERSPAESSDEGDSAREESSRSAPGPSLRTERLDLRPLRTSDAPRLRELAGNRQVARNTTSIPYPYPEGAAEAWITDQRDDDERIVFAVVRRGIDELIGGIGLHLEPEHDHGELGYWIGVDHWDRGYATEAAKAVVRFGFERLGLERIHARTFSRNPGSRKVLEKTGMRREGVLRRHAKKWGEFLDVESYGILLDDWLEDEAGGREQEPGGRTDD